MALALASPLSEEAIQTTGTIALCMFNRVMITSPKALLRGYPWMDTLLHEYSHMAINIAGRGRVPVWLHEGLAKFAERRWRSENGDPLLSPYSEWLLHERASQGKLVSFEEMHPSMALLPDQESAALAYAEVYAAIELITQVSGEKAIAEMLAAIAQGRKVEAAIAAAVGTSFDDFLQQWKRHLVTRERRYSEGEPPEIFEEIRFKNDANEDDKVAQVAGDAGRYMRLGDILQQAGRYKASAVEYQRAAAELPRSNPILQSRIGRVLLELGEVEAAVKALEAALDNGERYAPLYLYLAKARLSIGAWEQARNALLEAAALNPFDPQIPPILEQIYRAQGRQAEIEDLLSRTPPPL